MFTIWLSVKWGGGVFQKDDVGQAGGGGSKSLFWFDVFDG